MVYPTCENVSQQSTENLRELPEVIFPDAQHIVNWAEECECLFVNREGYRKQEDKTSEQESQAEDEKISESESSTEESEFSIERTESSSERTESSTKESESSPEETEFSTKESESSTEESELLKEIDTDLNKEKPQYISKKATFFQHDDRTADEIQDHGIFMENKEDKRKYKKFSQNNESQPQQKKENAKEYSPASSKNQHQVGRNIQKQSADNNEQAIANNMFSERVNASVIKKNKEQAKKKVSKDVEQKWTHDLFNEVEQKPKSRSELIKTYGYDLRKEDSQRGSRIHNRHGQDHRIFMGTREDKREYNKFSQNKNETQPQQKKENHKEYTLGSRKSEYYEDRSIKKQSPDNNKHTIAEQMFSETYVIQSLTEQTHSYNGLTNNARRIKNRIACPST